MGKEERMCLGGKNYLLDPETPGFDGKNISFVKLNSVRKLCVTARSAQNVSEIKTIKDLDLKIIRQILGFP